MTRTCRECRFFDLGEADPEVGRLGKCLLAKQRFGGDVTKLWSHPACKGFEDKMMGQKPGRKYQGVRRSR